MREKGQNASPGREISLTYFDSAAWTVTRSIVMPGARTTDDGDSYMVKTLQAKSVDRSGTSMAQAVRLKYLIVRTSPTLPKPDNTGGSPEPVQFRPESLI